MLELEKNMQNLKTIDEQSNLPYKHCLNCGAELKGVYCHCCGQEAVDKTPTIRGFVMTYIDNAFLWDSQFFKTFWGLIRRPGHLTNEYLAGKFTSQEHPLKLNMFLLFVFVTLFFFFASDERMTDSVYSLTKDERVFSAVQLQMLADDSEYARKMKDSPRDTILLRAPLFLTESFPQIISNIEIKEDAKGDALDKWVAVLPLVLIDDEIIVIDDSGYYHFNADSEFGNNELYLFNSVWAEMVRIVSQYFPMLLLLTVPFLSFSLRLVNRKSKVPGINHFIFALHYTAFLEFLMICIYILHLTVAPPMMFLEYAIIICPCIYLTVAYHRVYPSSWKKSFMKSLLTSFLYFTILLLIFIVIFLIACFIIAVNTNLDL